MNELHALAVNDAKMANQNGVDLNPFSTQGGRHLWQQGWDGVRPANLTDGSTNWRYWVRGGQARSIAKEAESDESGFAVAASVTQAALNVRRPRP